MERDEYRRLYELENDLWWFRGMKRISMALLERYAPAGAHRNVLDAGCGTGGMIDSLQTLGSVTGVDRELDALKRARQRSRPMLVQGDVEHLPLPAAHFDVVTSFDVLYHLNVSNDVAALAELARVTRPGGVVVVRVPALDALRSEHDEAVHTRQRYGRRELDDKLRRAGLEPLFISFANCLLFPVALVRRVSEKLRSTKRGASEVEAVTPWLNQMLYLPLAIEALLLRWVRLPFGLSLVAVARKP